jgi:hypothetical protein
MSAAPIALAEAVFARLSGDAELSALVGGRIHDRAPRNAVHPFVAFGTADVRPLDSDLAPASLHRFEIEAHSRYEGQAEAAAIAGRVVGLLHDASLTLDGHRLAQLRHIGTRTQSARGDRSYRAVMRFRALTEPLV